MNLIVEHIKKHPFLLVSSLVLIVLISIGLARSSHLAQLSDLKTELEIELNKINSNVKYSKDIEQDNQALEKIVNSINEHLFISDEQATNIDFFYSFEDSVDIAISEVKQVSRANPRYSDKGPDGLKIYSVIDYDITINGTFKNILRFFYEIHLIDNIMKVADVQIQINSQGDDQNSNLIANIRVTVLAKN